jgi:peptide deformylase
MGVQPSLAAMSILKVAQMGHPVLRTPTEPVDTDTIASADFQRLVDDMVETLHEYEGIGLAAPQVHVGQRVCLIGVVEQAEEGTPERVRILVAVNPAVTPLTEETSLGVEGCLSMTDLRGLVPRRRAVRLEALDRDGEPYAVELDGFAAVVAQHETDHLDGVLFVDRMPDLRSLAFGREFGRYGYGIEPETDVTA